MGAGFNVVTSAIASAVLPAAALGTNFTCSQSLVHLLRQMNRRPRPMPIFKRRFSLWWVMTGSGSEPDLLECRCYLRIQGLVGFGREAV